MTLLVVKQVTCTAIVPKFDDRMLQEARAMEPSALDTLSEDLACNKKVASHMAALSKGWMDKARACMREKEAYQQTVAALNGKGVRLTPDLVECMQKREASQKQAKEKKQQRADAKLKEWALATPRATQHAMLSSILRLSRFSAMTISAPVSGLPLLLPAACPPLPPKQPLLALPPPENSLPPAEASPPQLKFVPDGNEVLALPPIPPSRSRGSKAAPPKPKPTARKPAIAKNTTGKRHRKPTIEDVVNNVRKAASRRARQPSSTVKL